MILRVAASLVCIAALSSTAPVAAQHEGKTLIDFFKPMQPQGSLVSEGIWGAPNVLPRDIKNGLEDPTLMSWCYWDGKIVKSDDGRYHMYASAWTQTVNHHDGWHDASKGVHAVSDHPLGPYQHTGLLWPQWREGMGHNVVGMRMHDGRYAAWTSELTRGEIFTSDSPDGPFELLGEIQVVANGFDPGLARYDKNNAGAVKNNKVGYMSNVDIMIRPDDGRYMMVPRSCAILISDNGILGPYKIMSDCVYRDMPEVPQEKMEDPTVWYSGGMYHMVVNYHPDNVAHHLTSKDGVHDWKYRGIAFRNDGDFFKYTDSETVNHWPIVQRATVFVENGHPTHFNFSVIDVKKGQDRPNDSHGSKIVVVPFDGEAFDRHMQELVAAEAN